MVQDINGLTVREVLNLSQTNITRDPREGFGYAATAYDRAMAPDIMGEDPTAAGEGAAKAAFRLAQLPDNHYAEITKWFERSYDALAGDDGGKPRERIATAALKGRAFGLMSLRAISLSEAQTYEETADRAFVSGEVALVDQHRHKDKWDRYGTMLLRHYATFESVRPEGSIEIATRAAVHGIWRAITSSPETASKPDLPPATKSAEHALFIGKQVFMNTAALALATTKGLDRLSVLAKTRKYLAIKLLG